MGSGHFPDYDDKRSAYFKHIQNYNPNGHSSDLFGIPMIKLVDRPDCYGANNLFLEYKKGYMFNYVGCTSLSALHLIDCEEIDNVECLEYHGRDGPLEELLVKNCKGINHHDFLKFGLGVG
uniref:Neprosin PEP catalytic domain-containing protein n=1 Tax=Aegilops tauschii TaxID=37682 RepID=M8C6S1_AEGTA